MQIYVSDSSSDLVDAITELLGSHCEIILFNDLEDTTFEIGSFIFFDRENDRKFYSKSLKYFAKKKLELKVILIADAMSSKEIKKHQKSKEAASFYLKFPLNLDVLLAILDIEILDTTEKFVDLQDEIIDDLQEIIIDRDISIDNSLHVELSQRAKDISARLDSQFNLSQIDISQDSTAQVTGILEEVILDEVMEEFEDITLLDPTPEEDHTIQIQYEPNQLFPENEDLEYPDLNNNHEKELLKEIGDELDESLDLDNSLELSLSLESEGSEIESSEVSADYGSLDGLEFEDNADADVPFVLTGAVEESLEMSDEKLNLDDLNLDVDLSLTMSDDNIDLGDDISLDLSDNDAELDFSEDNLDLSIDESDDLDLNLGNEDLDLNLDLNDTFSLDEESNELSVATNNEELDLSIDASDDLSLDFNLEDEVNEFDSSLEEETIEPLMFDTLDTSISEDQTSNDISIDDTDEPSLSMTEPDLGFTKKTVADLELDQMDNSLHFGVESQNLESDLEDLEDQELTHDLKEDKGLELSKNINSLRDEEENLQGQLDEIDDLMSNDSLVQSDSTNNLDSADSSSNSDDYNDEQLIKLTETIKFLRMDRDKLEAKLYEIEDGKIDERRNVELYKSQLEEKGIEIEIMSKRYNKQIEKLQRNLEDANRQKEILLEKNKLISLKIDQGISKKEYDLSRIRKREIELENKLEMLKTDTQVQLKTREDKIIELKRRIDTLEFDMSNIQNNESNNVVKRNHLEQKLDKVIDTLRDAIEDLETSDVSLENIDELSKRLKNSI